MVNLCNRNKQSILLKNTLLLYAVMYKTFLVIVKKYNHKNGQCKHYHHKQDLCKQCHYKQRQCKLCHHKHGDRKKYRNVTLVVKTVSDRGKICHVYLLRLVPSATCQMLVASDNPPFLVRACTKETHTKNIHPVIIWAPCCIMFQIYLVQIRLTWNQWKTIVFYQILRNYVCCNYIAYASQIK